MVGARGIAQWQSASLCELGSTPAPKQTKSLDKQ